MHHASLRRIGWIPGKEVPVPSPSEAELLIYSISCRLANWETSPFTWICAICVLQERQCGRFLVQMLIPWRLSSILSPAPTTPMNSCPGSPSPSWPNASQHWCSQLLACTRWQCGPLASTGTTGRSSRNILSKGRQSCLLCCRLERGGNLNAIPKDFGLLFFSGALFYLEIIQEFSGVWFILATNYSSFHSINSFC